MKPNISHGHGVAPQQQPTKIAAIALANKLAQMAGVSGQSSTATGPRADERSSRLTAPAAITVRCWA